MYWHTFRCKPAIVKFEKLFTPIRQSSKSYATDTSSSQKNVGAALPTDRSLNFGYN
jgi:hypothetical protein